MSNLELLLAIAAWLGTALAAELVRRVVPGTKDDSQAVAILQTISRLMSFGLTSLVKGDGKLKP